MPSRNEALLAQSWRNIRVLGDVALVIHLGQKRTVPVTATLPVDWCQQLNLCVQCLIIRYTYVDRPSVYRTHRRPPTSAPIERNRFHHRPEACKGGIPALITQQSQNDRVDG